MYSVLYVDDEPALLEIAKLFLERSGEFIVDTKTSAQDGVETLLSNHSFDAILSDYQMPGMDGIAFLKEVRERFGDIPFLLFTGRGREEIAIQAIDNGADFYIQKGGDPRVQFAELAHKIRQAVRRKQAENELALLKTSVDQAHDEVFWLDFRGNILYVNEAACRATGYSCDELLRMTIFQLDPDFSPDLWKKSVDDLRESGHQVITTRHRRKDGTTLDVEVMTSYVRKDDREYSFAFVRDITERNRVEGALRESEEKYRELADLLPQMVFELDQNYQLTYTNRHALALFGVTDQDVRRGINVLSYIDPSQLEKVRENVRKQLNGISYEPEEYTALRKDGTRFPVLIYSSPVYRNKTLTGFRGVIVDISARKKLEEDLVKKNEALQAAYEELTSTEEELRENYEELTRREQTLRESEQRFRALIQNSSDLVRILDKNGLIVYDSPSSARLLGYPEGFFIGKNPLEYIHPEDRGRVERDLGTVYRQKNPGIPTEFRIRRSDGKYLYVESVASNMIGVPGVDGIVTTTRPVQDYHIAREDLKRSEEKFRGIFDMINDGIHLHEIDPDGKPGKFIEVNEGACRMLQYTREELLEHGPLDFVTGYHSRPFDEIIAELTTAGRSIFETEHRRKDGTLIPVEVHATVVSFLGRKVMASVVRDITERKQAEIALKESEKRYRDLFDYNYAVMMILNPETGAIVDANTAASRYYGYSHEEFVRKKITDINIADPASILSDMDLAITRGGKKFSFRHRKKSGEIRDVEVFSAPIILGGQRLLHSIILDVTERNQAEEALLLANRKLNLLSGITRHDIKNQLTALLGYLELTARPVKEPDTAAKFLEKERQIANAILHQIDFTRDYQDLGVKAPVWQNVKRLIRESMKTLPLGNIRVEFDPPDVEVLADPLLQKVFYNLLENAVRYGGDRMTTIRLSSRVTDTGMVILFSDDGTGISDEDKSRLFERGFGKHTGLGLFLSREILSITGITIAETGEPGKGALFEITVPAGAYRIADTA